MAINSCAWWGYIVRIMEFSKFDQEGIGWGRISRLDENQNILKVAFFKTLIKMALHNFKWLKMNVHPMLTFY